MKYRYWLRSAVSICGDHFKKFQNHNCGRNIKYHAQYLIHNETPIIYGGYYWFLVDCLKRGLVYYIHPDLTLMYGLYYNILRFYVDMCHSQDIDNTILRHRVHAHTHARVRRQTHAHIAQRTTTAVNLRKKAHMRHTSTKCLSAGSPM